MADILGTFEQSVLLAILRLKDGVYCAISAKCKYVWNGMSQPAPCMPHRAPGEENLIVSRLGSGTPIRGGRARRFYRLAAQGSACAQRLESSGRKSLARLKTATERIRNESHRHASPFSRTPVADASQTSRFRASRAISSKSIAIVSIQPADAGERTYGTSARRSGLWSLTAARLWAVLFAAQAHR